MFTWHYTLNPGHVAQLMKESKVQSRSLMNQLSYLLNSNVRTMSHSGAINGVKVKPGTVAGAC